MIPLMEGNGMLCGKVAKVSLQPYRANRRTLLPSYRSRPTTWPTKYYKEAISLPSLVAIP